MMCQEGIFIISTSFGVNLKPANANNEHLDCYGTILLKGGRPAMAGYQERQEDKTPTDRTNPLYGNRSLEGRNNPYLSDSSNKQDKHTPNLELDEFTNELRLNSDRILAQINDLLCGAKTKPTQQEKLEALAIGIYAEVVIKQHILGNYPFAINSIEQQQIKEDQELIAFISAEWVGKHWLAKHPESTAARAVSIQSIFASSDDHLKLLRELWPSIDLVLKETLGH